MNINDILPAKKEHYDYCDTKMFNEHCTCGVYEYNACLDDCAAALSKHNLVVCPTEEKIKQLVSSDEFVFGSGNLRAKALLALMRGER